MASTFTIEWDKAGEHYFESGVSHGVLYPAADNAYPKGVAWNGLTSFNESPEGGDASDFWADNIKYATLRAAESYGGTIECYTYPDEFAACNGEVELMSGVTIAQQARKGFGLCFRTEVGNDIDSNVGYKLHLIWGCSCSPSSKDHATINDSPDAGTMSFEFKSNPVNVTGQKPTSKMTIESLKAGSAKMAAIEKILYGDGSTEGRLPMPDEVMEILEAAA